MRVLGIDYGDSRVGVAVSDPLGITAQGVGTLKNNKKFMDELGKVLDKYRPETVVIGYPRNMDGSEGDRVEKTRKFANKLAEIYNGKIVFTDERLTTVAATRYLSATDTWGKKRKSVIDTVSACLILDTYLAASGSKE